MNSPVSSRNAKRNSWKRGTPHSQSGFTLLEILVASGVLAVMVTILFALFAEGSNAWRMGERVSEMNQGVRTAIELLIREASGAVIDTTTNSNLQGLRVEIAKQSTGYQPATDPSPHGVYEEICFVAPVDLGNEPTNRVASPIGYRPLCGVRYYVAKAARVGRHQQVLGNLTRVVYQTTSRGSAFDFYSNPWSMGGGTDTNSVVLAENVLCFRVQPAEYDVTQGVKPANSQMFRSSSSDQSKTIDYRNFSGAATRYPGFYVGLCVADTALASRINEMGLDNIAKTPLFRATTNWTLVHFTNFKP